MSYLGLRPIVEMQFIDFIVCAFNQITNFVAKGHYLWNAPAPMVVRGRPEAACMEGRSTRRIGDVFCAHAGAQGDLSLHAL